MPVETLPQLLQRAVHEHGPRTAMRYPTQEGWRPVTYAQVGRLVEEASVGLAELDVEPGDRVGLVAANGPRWAIADFATLHAGAVTTPIDPTLAPEAIAGILDDAGVEVCFVGEGCREAVAEAARQVETLSTIVLTGASPGQQAEPGREVGGVETTITMDQLYGEGQTVLGGEGSPSFERRWRAVSPGDLATLVYPAGTTGEPRGVELTHRNVTANVTGVSAVVDVRPGDRHLSHLPLAGSFERVVGHFATYHHGVEVWFARSTEDLTADLRACRPTLVWTQPRVLEAIKAHVEERLEASDPTQQRLFDWAQRVGNEVARARIGEGSSGLGPRVRHWLADRLVLAKLRHEMGLDEVRLAASGGEALDRELTEWFHAIGVPVLEGYGLAEAGPVVSLNRPGDLRLGSAGRPIPGVDVRIDTQVDEARDGAGEILVRGASIMQGYWNDDEATASALTEDGWLRTGDVGRVDEDGVLSVLDGRA